MKTTRDFSFATPKKKKNRVEASENTLRTVPTISSPRVEIRGAYSVMRGGDDDAMDLLRAASSSRARPASQGVQPDPPTSFTSPRKVPRRARFANTANHRISAEGRTRLVPLVPVVASRRRVTARVSIPHLTLHTHHLPRAFRLRADLHRGHAEGGGGEGRARGKSQGGVPLRRVSRRSRRREPAPERRAVGSADASRGNAR